jgi:hypothetical protein
VGVDAEAITGVALDVAVAEPFLLVALTSNRSLEPASLAAAV